MEAAANIGDNLKPWQFAYLEISMLLPTIITSVLFWEYGFPMITLLTILFLCYLIIPGIYMYVDKICTHNVRIVSSFGNILFNKSKQFIHGGVWFLVAGGIMFCALYFSLIYLDYWQFDRINLFYLPKTEVVTISVLMILVDPFLEEFFWRLFVQSAFKGGLTYSDPHELIIWFIALHYGLLYVFIFAVVTQKMIYAIIAAIPFVLISRKFSFVRKNGILASIIAHTGLNAGFVIILNMWFWNHWEISGWQAPQQQIASQQ